MTVPFLARQRACVLRVLKYKHPQLKFYETALVKNMFGNVKALRKYEQKRRDVMNVPVKPGGGGGICDKSIGCLATNAFITDSNPCKCHT